MWSGRIAVGSARSSSRWGRPLKKLPRGPSGPKTRGACFGRWGESRELFNAALSDSVGGGQYGAMKLLARQPWRVGRAAERPYHRGSSHSRGGPLALPASCWALVDSPVFVERGRRLDIENRAPAGPRAVTGSRALSSPSILPEIAEGRETWPLQERITQGRTRTAWPTGTGRTGRPVGASYGLRCKCRLDRVRLAAAMRIYHVHHET